MRVNAHDALNLPACSVCFRHVNEIKTKQVLLLAGTHVKALAVIRRIRNESAIFQHNPIF